MATIKGDKKLQKKFKKLANQIKSNKAPMYKRIGIKLLNEINNNFKTESHEGTPWPFPTLETVLARRGEGDIMLLQDTGLLRASFSPGHTDSRYKVNNDMIRVGTMTEYALTHEEGRDNIPQRKMLPSTKKALGISIKIADGYIDEKIKKAGL